MSTRLAKWGATCVGLLAFAPTAARADAQISFEVEALYASAPQPQSMLDSARQSALVQMGSSAPIVTTAPTLGSGILGVEVRPTFGFGRGLRVGVGFRTGETAGGGDNAQQATVFGGDVSLGFQRLFGRFQPYVEARFGFNAYDWSVNGVAAHAEQLRLDGVLGTRLYLTQALFLNACAFGGWGDQYGATVGLGFDMVRMRQRGVLP
jgi:hypothetical protein